MKAVMMLVGVNVDDVWFRTGLILIRLWGWVNIKAPSTRAETVFSPPFSFDALQEYLRKDGDIPASNASSCSNAVEHIQGANIQSRRR